MIKHELKIFPLVFCLAVISFYFNTFSISFAKAASSFDLSLSFDSFSSNVDVQTINYSLNSKFSVDNDTYGISKISDKNYYSPYSVNINSSLYQTKEYDNITNFRNYNDLQINLYINRFAFFFSDFQLLSDRALDISDEVSMGIGGGYSTSDDEDRILTLQAGIYSRTSIETELFSLLKSHLCWPILKDLSFVSDNNFAINLDRANDYRITNLDILRIQLHKNFNFETGFEINYINLADAGTVNSTRRCFAGINLSF